MKGHQEGRGWRETMRAEATTVSNAGSAAESGGHGAGGPVAIVRAWDPYEVWLKRVKQPRDRRIADQAR
jgi:hypothetical protein